MNSFWCSSMRCVKISLSKINNKKSYRSRSTLPSSLFALFRAEKVSDKVRCWKIPRRNGTVQRADTEPNGRTRHSAYPVALHFHPVIGSRSLVQVSRSFPLNISRLSSSSSFFSTIVWFIDHLFTFSGHCLLFSTGTWQEKDGLFDVRWASEANCNYPILVGVALFVIAGLQIYRWVWYLHRTYSL